MKEKLESLTMKPEDWSELDKSVTTEEYRRIVNEYQSREEEKLPFCKSCFKVCRYLTRLGRCGDRNWCSLQLKGV